MKKLIIGVWCFMFLLSSGISIAEVLEKQGIADISIKDYELVNSSQEDNILNRSFRLKVQNTGEITLYNVTATLIHISNNATFTEEAIFLGDITAGEIIISSDAFNCSVDTNQIPEGKLQYTWQIEYSNGNGADIVNEALVEELISDI